MLIEPITTKNAPEAIGPYSQAVKVGDFIFTSGQIPIDPKTGNVVSEDIEDQTMQVIENLKGVLNQSGIGLQNIVKTTLYIRSMDDFSSINKIYAQHFKEPYPARSCVEVSRLPKDVKIEIEAIAIVE